MVSTFLVQLDPVSHFPSTLHSDQLAGALLHSIGVLNGENFINQNLELSDPPFQLSSAFPFFYVNHDKIIRCLPFPMLPLLDQITTNYSITKDLKKAQFLEESLFWSLVRGRSSINDLYNDINRKYKVFNRCIVPNDVSFQKIFFEDSYRSHNQINRLNSKSEQFFHTKSSNFVNAGVFFILRVEKLEWLDYLKAGISFLQDQGLGGDISTGQGWFNATTIEYPEFPSLNSSSKHISLSLYAPKLTELENLDIPHSQYQLIQRQGRSRKGLMRKRVRLFIPGSLLSFKTPQTGPFGQVQVVQSANESQIPALVWGQALSVPMEVVS